MVEDKNQNFELTDHEAELYDRQIRLWGLESQKRQVYTNLTYKLMNYLNETNILPLFLFKFYRKNTNTVV